MKHDDMTPIIHKWMDLLKPVITRCEVAGSYRREKPESKDIDLVCIPVLESRKDLFGGDTGKKISRLEMWFATHNDGSLFTLLQNGPKKKKLALPEGLHLELYIVTPETWGVMFLIRTGPEEFSHWLVTKIQNGGALPRYCQIKDGNLWSAGKIIPTPEERDVFWALNLPYTEPKDRVAQWRR